MEGDTLLSVRKRAKLEITAREQSQTIWREGTESALQEGGKDYHPRINVPYVKGYFFYEAAGDEAERIALEEAERFADELADMLERSP